MKRTETNIATGETRDIELSAEEAAALQAEWEANRKAMRRERSIAAIEADLDTLTNAELLRFLKRLVAERVQADPKWLRRLNKPIDGDESMAP